MRVIFMGTPAFALPALQALINSPHEVIAVYSQPPRPAGRGQKLTPSPTQQLAEKHGIAVFTPISLKSVEAQAEFAALKADIAVVAAYGLLLPAPILTAPKYGCINIHPSDLPRWRGAAPIQRTIMAGDTHTACCIMQMDEGLDTGDVLLKRPYDIPADMNAGALHDVMAIMGAEMVLETLQAIENKEIKPKKQSINGVSYAQKIDKLELHINWNKQANEIYNFIRGLSPIPGAYCLIQGERVKILECQLLSGTYQHSPGTVFQQQGLAIQAGDGRALKILTVKREGKPTQNVADILTNWPVVTNEKIVIAS